MIVTMLRTNELDVDSRDGVDESFSYGEAGRLEYALEHALMFGLGSAGNVLIRELSMWRREWAEWRDTIMPKFITAFPGKRPAAAYITGEVPLRPITTPLPLSSTLRHTRCVYVNGGRDGFTYADLPEPYQHDEARHLYGCGVIDAEELRRYRGYSRAAGLRAYEWEIAQ